MKKLLLALSLVSVSGLVAQKSEYNFYADWHGSMSYDWEIQYNNEQGIEKFAQVTIERIDEKGKVSKQIRKHTEDGNLLSSVRFAKDGQEIKYQTTNEFDAKGNLLNSRHEKKGDILRTYEFTYNDDNKKTSMVKKKKGTKQEFKHTWEYKGEGDCLSQSEYFKKDRLHRVWKYEYYYADEKSKSQIFNGKGKLLKTWSYDCKPEGEELKVEKNENLVCQLKETEDGLMTRVRETFDSKGNTYKYISKFRVTDTDTILVSTQSFRGGKLRSESEFLEGYKFSVKNVQYKKNGKEYYRGLCTVKDGKVVGRESYWKGKFYESSEFIYKNDVISEIKRFNKKKELSSHSKYYFSES